LNLIKKCYLCFKWIILIEEQSFIRDK
jgi:hypothetical protein